MGRWRGELIEAEGGVVVAEFEAEGFDDEFMVLALG
jgi:hypothetical protein